MTKSKNTFFKSHKMANKEHTLKDMKIGLRRL